jgi:hypothetical protein
VWLILLPIGIVQHLQTFLMLCRRKQAGQVGGYLYHDAFWAAFSSTGFWHLLLPTQLVMTTTPMLLRAVGKCAELHTFGLCRNAPFLDR